MVKLEIKPGMQSFEKRNGHGKEENEGSRPINKGIIIFLFNRSIGLLCFNDVYLGKWNIVDVEAMELTAYLIIIFIVLI